MWLHYTLVIILVLLGLLVYFNGASKSKDKFFIFITFMVFFILSAFRSENIGNDTFRYIYLFERVVNEVGLSHFATGYESGYIYLNKIISLISPKPQTFLIITSAIIMTGFAFFIYKKSNNVFLSVFLFYTLGFFGSSLNILRQYIAILLILLAYEYIRKRKPLASIVLILLASQFHATAIIGLLLLLIPYIRFNYKTIILFISFSGLIYLAFGNVINFIFTISPKYNVYLGSAYFEGGIRLASILNFCIILMIFALGLFINNNNPTKKYFNNGKGEDKKDRSLISDEYAMQYLMLFSVCITFISLKFNLIERLSEYFFIFSIIYLPNILSKIRDKNLYRISVYLVAVFSFIYITVIFIFRPEWNRIFPYEFFWQL
jgi:hypothetical protein